MKHVIPTVTLDTNVLVEFWRNQNRATVTESLLNLAESSQVDLAITSRINADIPLPPLANRINQLPELKVQQIGAVFRLDHSALDGGDMLGSDEFLNVIELVEDQLDQQHKNRKRPDWRDWDHLHGHYLTGREVFLTWDGPILEVAAELKARLGVTVMKPEEFLDQLSKATSSS